MTNPAGAIYDGIGRGYRDARRPDPRIARQIWDAVGEARSIVNVGAGTGSYEPVDGPWVVAVEPSAQMRDQRATGAAPCVAGVAESLPFPDRAFEVATAFLTIHHWRDLDAGLAELQRVSRRQVLFTFDVQQHEAIWILSDYFPESAALAGSQMPRPGDVLDRLGGGRIEVIPVPGDCTDGFGAAYWRRPERYLDPQVQASISAIAQLPASVIERGSAALAADLASGRWHDRHGHLLDRDQIDAGYRLIIAGT